MYNTKGNLLVVGEKIFPGSSAISKVKVLRLYSRPQYVLKMFLNFGHFLPHVLIKKGQSSYKKECICLKLCLVLLSTSVIWFQASCKANTENQSYPSNSCYFKSECKQNNI